MLNKIFTSESVTEGHPDKVCDQISDAILDAHLDQDPTSRVACECFAGKNYLLIGGEITSNAVVNIDAVAREAINNIGYTRPELGFCGDTVAISCMINKQSSDIALGVDTGGAGDQGIMFGYACNETPELMPAPIYYAHALSKQLAKIRKETYGNKIFPDGKTQVSVEYEAGKVKRIDTILISTQHSEYISMEELRVILTEDIIKTVIPSEYMDEYTKILINPTGRFVIGGPVGDTGLTGRKIIVDSYGGYSRHGGGCWSGKDPTKVDRSASYMARYLAKNIVASKICNKCEIQLAYAIGVVEPVSVYVETDAGEDTDRRIEKLISTHVDLSPNGIINLLNLRDVEYKLLAAYGHLGRDENIAPWEKTDLVELFSSL